MRRSPAARPPTKREQRAASIEALLTEALTLFITQGYHATTVEEIAQAASLTKGAVYFYFKSKANVLMALLDRTEELTVEPTLAAMEKAGSDPVDRLHAFIRTQSVIGAEKTEYMLLAILMSAEFNGSGDEIEIRLNGLMARMEDALRDTVKATDGNLSTHLRKLEEVRYVQLEKKFVDRKPRTECALTDTGRAAFRAYVARLEALVRS